MSKPLRILQIVPSISLVYGGPSQMVLGLSSALASQGVEVTVLTTDSNGDIGQPPLDVPLDKPVEQDGYQVRYFHCSPFRRYKFSLNLLRWLWQHASEFDLAHIHALFSPVSSAAAAIARQKKLPYILRPLGTLDPADLRKKRQLKQIYAALLEGPNLAGAAGIHFTSAQEAKVSERFGTQTRDLVIPLGVHSPQLREEIGKTSYAKGEARRQLGIPEDQPLVLFMSRIDPKKGLNLLIPALESLLVGETDKKNRPQGNGVLGNGEWGMGNRERATNYQIPITQSASVDSSSPTRDEVSSSIPDESPLPNFHFVLAGTNPQDPDYEHKIREQIEASPLSSCTTITGFVTGELKAALLQDADLFVLPSYYENFGIAVAEAMVAGTPVVISDRVYIWEDIQGAEAGWICSCESYSLATVLREALQDEGERQRRGENARNYALKHYSWDAIALATIDAYQKILNFT